MAAYCVLIEPCPGEEKLVNILVRAANEDYTFTELPIDIAGPALERALDNLASEGTGPFDVFDYSYTVVFHQVKSAWPGAKPIYYFVLLYGAEPVDAGSFDPFETYASLKAALDSK